LFVIRNAASSRKHSCGSRGRRGAASASRAIAAKATIRAAADSSLSTLSWEVPSLGRLKYSNIYQTEPQSAPRFLLNTKK
jgi:hypothetical protein